MRKLFIVLLAALVAVGVAAAQTTYSDPSWDLVYHTATLQVGEHYNFSLGPTAAMCNSGVGQRSTGRTDTAIDGGKTSERENNFGFRARTEGSDPWIIHNRHFGPVNGISLEFRGRTLHVVGTPLKATTGLGLPVRVDRYCVYESGGQAYFGGAIRLKFVGSGHTASPHSVAHGHTHTEYTLSTHTHTAPDLSGYVPLNLYNALLARVQANEYANTCRNLGGYYDGAWTGGVSTRAIPTTHCCIPAESDSSISTASQCQASKVARQTVIPGPAPDAPSGGAEVPDLR